jgi:hypothetical protein
MTTPSRKPGPVLWPGPAAMLSIALTVLGFYIMVEPVRLGAGEVVLSSACVGLSLILALDARRAIGPVRIFGWMALFASLAVVGLFVYSGVRKLL